MAAKFGYGVGDNISTINAQHGIDIPIRGVYMRRTRRHHKHVQNMIFLRHDVVSVGGSMVLYEAAGTVVEPDTPGRHTGNLTSRNELPPQVFPSPFDPARPTRSRLVPRVFVPTRPLSIQSWACSCCSPGHALWRDLPISVVSRPPEDPSLGPVLGPEPVSPRSIFYPNNEHGPLLSLDVHTGGALRRRLMPANRQCGA